MSTREPINIDPKIREALFQHLLSPSYAGTGIGYSEFIRHALILDGCTYVPEDVQPDDRWGGSAYKPYDKPNGPRQEK